MKFSSYNSEIINSVKHGDQYIYVDEGNREKVISKG